MSTGSGEIIKLLLMITGAECSGQWEDEKGREQLIRTKC